MILDSLVIVLALIVFLVVTEFFFFDFTGFGWRKAKKEFSNAGKKLGLNFIKPKYKFNIGELKGVYENHEVVVVPDDGAKIKIKLDYDGNMELRTVSDNYTSPPNGMQHIQANGSVFNSFFKTRYAHASLASKISQSDELAQFIKIFKGKWGRKIEYLEINNSSLIVSMKYGKESYIPSKVINDILPDLVKLAGIIETL